MQTTWEDSLTMPVGYAGGTPELWDHVHATDETLLPDEVYFRSAPARAIRAALLRCVGLKDQRVAELGCGGSRWLRILSEQLEARTWGVDFSPRGVESTRRQLRDAGADDSNIVVGRIREFAERHSGMFDVAISFGLIEHFYDLADVLATHVRCARPGGRVFVAAPNLSAVNLRWTRAVASDILSWHRPLTAFEVASCLERQGCSDILCAHLGGPRLFVRPTAEGCRTRVARTLAHAALKAFNGAGELLYRVTPELATGLAGPRLSPYFAVSATTPGA
jgi:SAM-dependent methyltransferase